MNDAPATKKDVDDVLDTLREFMGMVAEQFEAMNGTMNKKFSTVHEEFRQVHEEFRQVHEEIDNIKGDLNRIEHKLDPTIEQVDDHEIRIKTLEQQTI